MTTIRIMLGRNATRMDNMDNLTDSHAHFRSFSYQFVNACSQECGTKIDVTASWTMQTSMTANGQ